MRVRAEPDETTGDTLPWEALRTTRQDTCHPTSSPEWSARRAAVDTATDMLHAKGYAGAQYEYKYGIVRYYKRRRTRGLSRAWTLTHTR